MSDVFSGGACRLRKEEFAPADPAPPRLKNALARLDCVAEQRLPMGDHLTIVGRVLEFDSRAGDALTYFRGRYGTAADPHEG